MSLHHRGWTKGINIGLMSWQKMRQRILSAHLMKRFGISFLVSLAVWLVMSWPLPRHVADAIPYGADRPCATSVVQSMVPGDHLQLLYHFWLFSDMLAGHTPWGYNLYEFNAGDDKARWEPSAFFFPFSLFYAAGRAVVTEAFGWNLAGFLSLWFTFYFTWLLVRRYGSGEWATGLAAVLAITIPYRWINMAGGSPTGFAMMWVPAVMLGLDIAVRDGRWTGGLMAGAGMLMTIWGDSHLFFFAALLVPAWCIVALVARKDFDWRDRHGYLRMALALAPAALGALAAAGWSTIIAKRISESHVQNLRTIQEVKLFSSHPSGFYAWGAAGLSDHIYVGFAFLLLLCAGGLLFVRLRRTEARTAWILAILLAGLVGIMTLAVGPFGPLEGLAFRAARKLIPGYAMLRQPAKIFCIMPTIAAVAFGIVATRIESRAWRIAVFSLLALSAVEYKSRFMPQLCLLDRKQDAYAAAAAINPARPHALVIPLWPGDSHHTSAYQHYASIYHLRLVNGYRPFVRKEYLDTVYARFRSMNFGEFDNAMADELLHRGVGSILVHKDLFPDKVSPFSATHTLARLLANPRLRYLKQDDSVWAFEILRTPRTDAVARPEALIPPARRYEIEKMAPKARTVKDADCSGGRFVTMDAQSGNAFVRPTSSRPEPGLRWMLRARGQGVIQWASVTDAGSKVTRMSVDTNTWGWIDIPIDLAQPATITSRFCVVEGKLDLDTLLLAAGPWTPPASGETVSLPAALLFNTGQAGTELGEVRIERPHNGPGIVLFGPKLPLTRGPHRIELDYATGAPAGTLLGTLRIECPEGRELRRMDAKAGEPARIDVDIPCNAPFLAIFEYAAQADLTARTLRISRVP